MNNQDIDNIFKKLGIAHSVSKIETYPNIRWLLQASGIPILVQTQESVNRMRIVAFIKKISEADHSHYNTMLTANYHSALDVRYALTDDEFVVAAFLHPLNELSMEQFFQALMQVISCAKTFGESFSGGLLHFGRSSDHASGSGASSDPISNLQEMVNKQVSGNKIFISYNREDSEWRDKFLKVIKPLIRDNSISVWHDGHIKPSEKWREEINTAMQTAKIALLFVSPDFLASDFIVQEELPYFFSAARSGRTKVTWMHVCASLYVATEIADYQALHDVRKPLNTLSEAELSTTMVDACMKLLALANS